VIATLAVVCLLDGDTDATQSRSVDENLPPEKSVEVQRANPVIENGGAAEEDREDPSMPTSAEAVSTEDGSALQAHMTVQPEQDVRSLSPAQRSTPRNSSDEYPPEIADMIANSVDKDLQSRYENEDREDSWAPYMEGLLAAYFAQKPSLSQFYFSLIDCRTSICEIHALGYGLDALTQWNTATADMVSQPWFEFNSMSMNRRNPEPDILGIVLILTKKPPD